MTSISSPNCVSKQDKGSAECFYRREDGTKGDNWIHEEILNNPEADRDFIESVIRAAMLEDGLSRKQAEELYS